MSYNKEFIRERQVAWMLTERTRGIISKNKDRIEVERKEDGSPVTNIDKMISAMIREKLKKKFPDYGILDEENTSQDERGQKERCWVVDPLDGTYDFIKGGRHFGTMIGLLDMYEPVVGAVHQPLKNGIIYANRGGGAYKDMMDRERKIQVSRSDKIDLVVSRARMNDKLYDIIRELDPETVTMMPTSFKMLEVALGKYNAFINMPENEFSVWDTCAHQVIVEEAGGKITDFYGNPLDYSKSFDLKKGVVATNGLIHDKVIKITSNYHKEAAR